jgi:hypothetical protein
MPLYPIPTDGAFAVRLPADWQVVRATWQWFSAWSPAGESVVAAMLPVTDDRSAQLFRSFLDPQVFNLLFPIVSPPLDPLKVIGRLVPQLNRAVQQLTILGSQPVALPGASAALVRYRYTLVPGLADPTLRADIAPALLAQSQVPMDGGALVVTTPAMNGTWGLLIHGTNAPQALSARNVPLYLRIWQTFQYDEAAIQRDLASRAANAAQIQERLNRIQRLHRETLAHMGPGKVEKNWWYVLGGEAPYHDRQSNVHPISIHNVPGPDKRVWYCPSRSDRPIVAPKEHPPLITGCEELKPGLP